MSANIRRHIAAGEAVEICEVDQAGTIQRKWLHTPQDELLPLRFGRQSTGHVSATLRVWRKAISDAFLPVGFPHSVSPDYFAYQTFDSLQAFFSTIVALLANRALLAGLGVGDPNSSATFALLLTVAKDGTSRVATIVFAHRFGRAIEPECKRYRFLADLFNDSAFFLELLSPFLATTGKVLALTTGEVLRALCGVAAGASKAALSAHFALFDNLAELNAKEASQETAVGLAGLIVGSFIVRWIEDQRAVFWIMIVLVLIHLWMNYLGVSYVWLRTLNRQRATIVFHEYLRTGLVLGPEATARKEAIVFWRPVMRNRHGEVAARISFAKNYHEALGHPKTRKEVHIMEGDGYALFLWTHTREPMLIKIMLWEGSTCKQGIAAWFHAMEIAWIMDPLRGFTPELAEVYRDRTARDERELKLEENAERGSETGWLLDYQPKWSTQSVGERLEQAGWDISAMSFETEAPVRLRAVAQGSDYDKKKQ